MYGFILLQHHSDQRLRASKVGAEYPLFSFNRMGRNVINAYGHQWSEQSAMKRTTLLLIASDQRLRASKVGADLLIEWGHRLCRGDQRLVALKVGAGQGSKFP